MAGTFPVRGPKSETYRSLGLSDPDRPVWSEPSERSELRSSDLRTLSRTGSFRRLDEVGAVAHIRRLADLGMTDVMLVAYTRWSIGDVCRALAGRL